MDIEKLIAERSKLLAAAEVALDNASKSMDAEDFEKANEYQGEFTDLKARADALQKQIDSAKSLEDAKSVDNKVNRLPFSADDTDDDAPAEEENAMQKSVHVLKYGDLDKQVGALVKDLYGNTSEYMQKRYDQQRSFVKYLRTGRTDINDEKLLKELIMLPEQLKEDVIMDVDYKTVKATLQESLAGLGDVLVPEDYRVQLIKRMEEMTIIRSLARVVTTNRDAAEWPRLEGGNDRYTSAVRVTWIDEVPADANVAETNPTFGLVRVPVNTVMARTDVSKNMLEDSAFNVVDVISQLFSESQAVDEDTQFITGTGGGRPRGILGNRSGAEATPEDGIAAVNTGDASAVTADGIINLIYNLPAQYRNGAILIGARTSHRDLRKLKDGNGDYLWQSGLAAGQPANILGYPFRESESMPAIAANSYPLIFGKMTGYLIVDRIGMGVQRVEDTTTTGRNKVAIFMRRRLGGQAVEPWCFNAQKVSA